MHLFFARTTAKGALRCETRPGREEGVVLSALTAGDWRRGRARLVRAGRSRSACTTTARPCRLDHAGLHTYVSGASDGGGWTPHWKRLGFLDAGTANPGVFWPSISKAMARPAHGKKYGQCDGSVRAHHVFRNPKTSRTSLSRRPGSGHVRGHRGTIKCGLRSRGRLCRVTGDNPFVTLGAGNIFKTTRTSRRRNTRNQPDPTAELRGRRAWRDF